MTDPARIESQTEVSLKSDQPKERRSIIRRMRPWHWYSIAWLMIITAPLFWFALAYGGLPRLWSHHEHKKIGTRDEIVSVTARDIPGDPINLHLKGEQSAITSASKHAGWSVADPVTPSRCLPEGLHDRLHDLRKGDTYEMALIDLLWRLAENKYFNSYRNMSIMFLFISVGQRENLISH